MCLLLDRRVEEGGETPEAPEAERMAYADEAGSAEPIEQYNADQRDFEHFSSLNKNGRA